MGNLSCLVTPSASLMSSYFNITSTHRKLALFLSRSRLIFESEDVALRLEMHKFGIAE